MTIIEADGVCEGAATCKVKQEVTLGGEKNPGSEQKRTHR